MATLENSSFQQHWSYFVAGLEDASNWPKTFILLYSSKTIQKAVLSVFALNGVLFLGGQLLLEALHPRTLFGCSFLHLLGFPMFFALLAINGRFFGKVAEKSYQIQKTQQKTTTTNPVQNAASGIFTTILYINCGLTAALLSKIPFIGLALSFLMNCIITSYYCFEFKWVYFGWNIEQRLSYMEKHWSFFLGFGFPMTVLTFFLTFLRSSAIFNLVYPFFIIMAIFAVPRASTPYNQKLASGTNAQSEWTLPNRVPIFLLVRKLNDLVILVVRLVGGVRVIQEQKKDELKKE
ncbi:hypothetical protein G6F37_009110 [Rhizopus arrhizus]|nr:hypothetical protein G6F38_009424 [Rhizopus arrhizus]KAG1154818.1 hypothetical protein G6F37_009110 [Rhizopus arrhizus]